MSKKAVTMIPATISRFTSTPINEVRKRRAAGYARVSTDHEEQLTSYEAQVDYYTNYIKSREDWEFILVYTDEGISATTTAKRDGFNKIVSDALAGKIDLIVTKSVSRFARNTVDSLTTIRKLKENGVEVYFEKEGIWTFDGKGELLITIMSSLAQEESRSISKNCTWGQRKRFSDGKVCVPYSRFLGYDRGEEGGLVVNEEEAVTIRLIYKMFLEGATPHSIAKCLSEQGSLSPGGKEIWNQSAVKSILTNEKYKGDALLQKSYTVDFLTKKKKMNEGEIPQYYVENLHEGIIEPLVYEMVQQEMARRKPGKNRHSGVGLFASRIKCGDCGGWYGSKVWHSNTKYRRTIWQCNHKFKNDGKCKTPNLDEESIKSLFVSAVNKLLADKDEIIANFAIVRDTLFSTADIETEVKELKSELSVVAELMQKCIEENARVALDQAEYQERYDGLVARFDKAKARYDEVTGLISERKARGEMMDAFIAELQKQDGVITEFDERLWYTLVDFATVYKESDVRFTFKNGVEIQV
jgi:DNA invertase Pin-like site-specific DNA recombinase/regulator of replication initiation timing